MTQDKDNFLTPEQIWKDFRSGRVKSSDAIYLLKTILENSLKISIRLGAIETIGKINKINEESFKLLESCLLSDEHQLVRAFSIFLIYVMFPNKRNRLLKWVRRKDISLLVRHISQILAKKADGESKNHYFVSWEDFKVKYLVDYYGVVPDEIGFIVDLEIFLDDQFPRDYKYSLRNLQKLDYASPLSDENENRWLINHWFGDIMGFTYVVENKRIVGLNLPVLGDVILEMFSKSIAKLSNLQYLTLNLLKSVPKSLTSIRSLKGLLLRTTTKCKKLLLPDDISNLRSLKVIELSRSFFNPVSKPLLSLIKQNIASRYTKQGVHSDDAVSLGLLDAYLGRDIERDYGYQENRFDINEQGRVVSIKLLEDQGYNPFMSIPNPIYNFRFLERLAIRHIHLSYISSKIKKLNKLRELDLQNNQIKAIPRFISKLKNLEKLILRGTKIEKFPEVLTSLTSLKYLDLSETKIKTIPDSISNLNNLEYLGLYINQIEKIPVSVKGLEKLENLSDLIKFVKD